MSIKYRPLRTRDIPNLTEHFRLHPLLQSRYGAAIEDLPEALRQTLRCDYVVTNLFEESLGSTIRLLGAGMAAFVSDEFLQSVKDTGCWLGPELVKQIVSGKSPLLSEDEVRDANSTGSLNLMVWHSSFHSDDMRRPDVAMMIITAFEETFRGFRLREIFFQADSLAHLQGSRATGALYYHRAQRSYGEFPEIDEHNFSEQPHNGGLTRELAMVQFGTCTWVGSMFMYEAPQIAFSTSEQRLLLSALKYAETDEELSEVLRISLSAVKKSWRSVYERVAQTLPELFPDESVHSSMESRGKQKKQRLLAYLREHPEELRPFSRKLLPAHSASALRSH